MTEPIILAALYPVRSQAERKMTNQEREAFEAMLEALLFAAETLATMTTDTYSKGGDAVLRNRIRAALAVATRERKP